MRILIAGFLLLASFVDATAGTITGTVRSAATQQPIAGAQLTFTRPGPAGLNATIGQASTSGDGTYSFTTNYTGFGGITVSAAGFVNQTREIQYGSNPMTQDFSMVVGGQISGRVYDAGTGQPLASLEIRLYASNGTQFTSTDQTGGYAFVNLAEGTYGVCALGVIVEYMEQCWEQIIPAPALSPSNFTPIALATGENRSGIDIPLARGALVSGQVRDRAFDEAISNTTVQLQLVETTRGLSIIETQTDVSGVFRLRGVAPGTYQLRIAINTPFYTPQVFRNIDCEPSPCPQGEEFVVGQDLTGRSDIDFNLLPGGRIVGLVVDSQTGMPINGARVDLRGGSLFGFVVERGSTLTRPDGRFWFRHVPPSEHIVIVQSPEHLSQRWPGIECLTNCTNPNPTGFTIPINGAFDAGQFNLNRGAIIRGRTRPPGYGQSPVVQLYNINGSFITSASDSSGSGTYQLPALPSGTYFIDAIRNSECQRFLNLTCNGAATMGTPVILAAPGQVFEADFQFSSEGIFTSGFEP